MIKFLRLCVLVIPVITLFISCSDSPTSVGSNLIQDQDKISFKQFDTYTENVKQNSYSYSKVIALGSGSYLIFGKTDYAESDVMLRFSIYLADSILTRIKNNEMYVKKAWMTMSTSYLLGEKTAPFDFTVHKIKDTDWETYTFDRDSLSKLVYDGTDISSSHAFTDTTITFDMKSSVVSEWLKAMYDSANTPKNCGILIKPTAGTSKMRGTLVPSSTETTDYMVLHFELERIPAASKTDSTYVTPAYFTTFMKELKTPTTNYLYLQGGYSHRGFLSLDLSKLPKDVIVSKAILELTQNTSLSTDGTPSSSNVSVSMLADSTNKKYTSDSTYTSTLTKSGSIYSGDISWMIQRLLHGLENQGLELVLTDEYSTAARIAFHGSNDADKSKRPRLKIYYTTK